MREGVVTTILTFLQLHQPPIIQLQQRSFSRISCRFHQNPHQVFQDFRIIICGPGSN